MLKIIQYNSPLILTYTLVSLAAVLLGYATDNATTIAFFSVYYTSFSDPVMYLRMITHVIGHADFAHYFNNFMLILLIGPMLEEKYGAKKLIIMMLVTAILTGLLSVLFFDVILLGASGIVFMLILLSSFVNLEKGRIPITLIFVIVIFIGREIVDGLIYTDNVSRLSHIFGGICGAFAGIVTNKNKLMEG